MKEESNDWNWIWIERFIPSVPISYFSLSYILFIIISSIYVFFDMKVSWLDLSDLYQFLATFFTSLLIPFEIMAIKLMLDGVRERFGVLCSYFKNSQGQLNEPIKKLVFDKKINYFIVLLIIGFPLFLCRFDGFPYYHINSDDINYLGLDLYRIFLLTISICLLCLLFWIFINIHISFAMISKKVRRDAQDYNIAILNRKIIPVRNYFLIILLIFMIGFSIFNASIIVEPIDEDKMYKIQASLSLILMSFLFLIGIALTLNSLRNAQSIVDNAVDYKMDQIDRRIRNTSVEINALLEGKSKKDNKESDNLQKILELQQKEWDKISQERTGMNLKESLKEACAFVASILIPIISFLITAKK